MTCARSWLGIWNWHDQWLCAWRDIIATPATSSHHHPNSSFSLSTTYTGRHLTLTTDEPLAAFPLLFPVQAQHPPSPSVYGPCKGDRATHHPDKAREAEKAGTSVRAAGDFLLGHQLTRCPWKDCLSSRVFPSTWLLVRVLRKPDSNGSQVNIEFLIKNGHHSPRRCS